MQEGGDFMIKERESLENYLAIKCADISRDRGNKKIVYTYCKDKYDFPRGVVLDYIDGRKSMQEATEYILFVLLDALKENDFCLHTLNYYFNDLEIKTYKELQYLHPERIDFPLILDVTEVNEDQWVGASSVDFLMKLRDAQLINYNINTQRTMQHIVRGNKEYYKITINKRAIREIKESFNEQNYIPNTITLNIPYDTEADFYYDKNKKKLVINKLEHFDILDGYHRYVAMCQIRDLHSNFDYPMELRIVNYDVGKANHFIHQEDQKTKMSKIDSDSYNTNNAAVIVVTRLNENVNCNLKGTINRNDGLINFGELVELVNKIYFSNTKRNQERVVIVNTIKELTNCFNIITEYDTKYLTEKYSFKLLTIILVAYNHLQDKTKLGKVVDSIYNNQKLDSRKFRSRVLRKDLQMNIEQLVEEVK